MVSDPHRLRRRSRHRVGAPPSRNACNTCPTIALLHGSWLTHRPTRQVVKSGIAIGSGNHVPPILPHLRKHSNGEFVSSTFWVRQFARESVRDMF